MSTTKDYLGEVFSTGFLARQNGLPTCWRGGCRNYDYEEAVQGAGMVGLFQAQGAAESDASVRL
jgi:hypothetical protein